MDTNEFTRFFKSKIGDRVLMNDTDSIVYIYDPSKYNIPEGKVLGDWEREKNDKLNGGILEFVGIAPKTYAYKTRNSKTFVKAKGISIKHFNKITFDEMKQLANKTISEIKKPQKTFQYTLTEGMRTLNTMKILKIKESELKGTFNENGYLLPFGYNL